MNDSSFPQPESLPSVSSSLLLGVQQMRPEAWARLVEVFSPIVYRWARQSGVGKSEAADIVQDVFIAVAAHVRNFSRQKQQGSFRSWLATITRNRVRDYYRKQQQLPRAFGGTGPLQRLQNVSQTEAPDQPDLEHTISVADLDQRVPHRVLQLVRDDCEEQTWQAFWATTVLGDQAADVADRLKLSVTSVYQAKSRVLRRIRKRLKELP